MTTSPSSAPLFPSRSTHDTPPSLLTLPFPAFVRMVCVLLTRLGYHNVGPVKPMHKRGRGRNAHGGLDIEAYLQNGLTRTRVIAQIKQYSRPVPRSFVDELRGAMLREGVQQGLLVTTATFSPTARDAASALADTLPIRLVDGAELARLLLAQGVPMQIPQESNNSQPLYGNMSQEREAKSGSGTVHTTASSRPNSRPDSKHPLRIPPHASDVTITLTLHTPKRRTERTDTPDAPAV